MKRLVLASLVAMIALVSCSKDDAPASVIVTGTKTVTANFSPSSSFAFFRFSDSSIVANSDSATTKWDFGVRYTTFITNSGVSGPGAGGAIVQTGTTFDAVKFAPATGYGYDTTSSKLAINPNTWYNYDPATRTFSPKAGQIFIFKTADGGHYAKVELLSVAYGGQPTPTAPPTLLYYTFRYSYQANGTTTF